MKQLSEKTREVKYKSKTRGLIKQIHWEIYKRLEVIGSAEYMCFEERCECARLWRPLDVRSLECERVLVQVNCCG